MTRSAFSSVLLLAFFAGCATVAPKTAQFSPIREEWTGQFYYEPGTKEHPAHVWFTIDRGNGVLEDRLAGMLVGPGEVIFPVPASTTLATAVTIIPNRPGVHVILGMSDCILRRGVRQDLIADDMEGESPRDNLFPVQGTDVEAYRFQVLEFENEYIGPCVQFRANQAPVLR